MLTEGEKELLQAMYAKRAVREFGGPDPIPLLAEINRLREHVCGKLATDPEKYKRALMTDGRETEVFDPLLQIQVQHTSLGGVSYAFYLQIGGVYNGELLIDSRELVDNKTFVELSRIRPDSILIQKGPMISSTQFRPDEQILINPQSPLIDLPTATRVHHSIRTPLATYLRKPIPQ